MTWSWGKHSLTAKEIPRPPLYHLLIGPWGNSYTCYTINVCSGLPGPAYMNLPVEAPPGHVDESHPMATETSSRALGASTLLADYSM